MDELIKITKHEGKEVVNARELHEFLGSKQQFADWIKGRIEKYGFVENKDYVTFHKIMKRQTGAGAARVTQYAITINMAKELGMIENNEAGRKIRTFFISREDQLKSLEEKARIDFSDPDTVLRLAQNWKEEQVKRIEAEKAVRIQRERLQLQEGVIEKAKPKVDYYDEVLQSEGMIAISVIAKELNISAVRLNKFLYKQGVQYQCNGTWLLYSAYQDKGYTKTRTVPYTDEHGNIKTNIHTYWTEKGRKFIHDLWRKRNGRPLKLELN